MQFSFEESRSEKRKTKLKEERKNCKQNRQYLCCVVEISACVCTCFLFNNV